jgi:tetratricopeptide (TPR) repeat protein
MNTKFGRVILWEAQPGKARRDRLQQWLGSEQNEGATTWLLPCDRYAGGPWAGLKELFEHLLPEVQAIAPDLIVKHDYELANVLPGLRRNMSVRNPTLTDVAASNERVRNYPADRAFRIASGLVDLLASWRQRSGDNSAWIIAGDDYNRAGALVSRFFVELIRRCGEELNLTLLLTNDPGTVDAVASQFDGKYISEIVKFDLPVDSHSSFSLAETTQLAEELEREVKDDLIALEMHVAQLIYYWQLSDRPDKVLMYQIQAFSIYTTRGLYRDALMYGEPAWRNVENYYPQDLEKRWAICVKLFNCYAGLDLPLKALAVMEEMMNQTNHPEHLFRACYLMSMMYARYLPQLDLDKAEAYLEQGLVELNRTSLPEAAKFFHTAFNRNGLALIRHRQGRSLEAVEICQSCYQELNNYLKPDEHRLHRSVLLFNIAQVYGSTGDNERAIAYITKAMVMDPNYSEYYNDRGNLYMKLERWSDALNDYLQAIELSPPYWEVWANLGRCYRMLNQFPQAIDAYSTSIDLDPDRLGVLVARAEVFEIIEKPEAALADYHAVLAIDPDQPLVLANRAILYYNAGQYREAVADLDKAIALSPENPDLYQNRAVALSSLGRFDEVVRDLRTYLRLNPDAEDRLDVETQLLALQ